MKNAEPKKFFGVSCQQLITFISCLTKCLTAAEICDKSGET